jgi:hypothetical protein
MNKNGVFNKEVLYINVSTIEVLPRMMSRCLVLPFGETEKFFMQLS